MNLQEFIKNNSDNSIILDFYLQYQKDLDKFLNAVWKEIISDDIESQKRFCDSVNQFFNAPLLSVLEFSVIPKTEEAYFKFAFGFLQFAAETYSVGGIPINYQNQEVEIKKMEMEKKDLGQKIFQDNKFIQKRKNAFKAMCILDEYQIKFFSLLLSRIKQEDKEFKWEEIGFNQFLNFMNLKSGGKQYEQLYKSMIKLMDAKIALEIIPGNISFFHLFASGSTISFTEKKIIIKLDDSLKPFFLGLNNNFTCYELGFISKLRGKYTCRLYEYLHSYTNLKAPCIIPLEKMINEITDGKYSIITDIERFVITKALKEINEKSDIKATYKKEQRKNPKSGKMQTIGWRFYITSKTEKEIKNIVQSWGLEDDEIRQILEKHNKKTNNKLNGSEIIEAERIIKEHKETLHSKKPATRSLEPSEWVFGEDVEIPSVFLNEDSEELPFI